MRLSAFFAVCTTCLSTPSCGGIPGEPTPQDASAFVRIVEPMAGATLTVGTAFAIGYGMRSASVGTALAIAFVRDDGAYSPVIHCHGLGFVPNAGPSVGAVEGIVGRNQPGTILYEFGRGHRVNAVMFLRSPFEVPPTECPVSSANADQRVDITLNWFVEP